jgi:hypothetical protein
VNGLSNVKDREIEIVLAGKTLTAELLWKDAPKTCELILKALPLDQTTTKDGGVVRPCTGQSSMLIRWLKTFTVPLEHATVYLRNGYLYWKTYEEPVRDGRFETSLNELHICGGGTGGGGGYGYSWSPQGPDPLNEFARITDERQTVTDVMMGMYTESNRTILVKRKG